MTSIVCVNKKSGKKYKVIKFDREKGEVTLQGEQSQFTEKYTKERFAHLGYVIEKEETAA